MTKDGASIVKPRETLDTIPELALQANQTMITTKIMVITVISKNIVVNVPKISPNGSNISNCNQFSPFEVLRVRLLAEGLLLFVEGKLREIQSEPPSELIKDAREADHSRISWRLND